MIRIFDMVGFGNYGISVWMNTENKNENEITIWDNTMGELYYKNTQIWDSDLTKIIRTLKKYQYSRLDIHQISKKLTTNCRHLDLI